GTQKGQVREAPALLTAYSRTTSALRARGAVEPHALLQLVTALRRDSRLKVGVVEGLFRLRIQHAAGNESIGCRGIRGRREVRIAGPAPLAPRFEPLGVQRDPLLRDDLRKRGR